MGAKYRYKRRPYHHQVAALKFLLKQKWGGALLMSPRTGKTKVAVDWSSILHQKHKISRILVVCPNRIMGVWVDEITANCPFPHRIIVWDKDGRKRTNLPPISAQRLTFVILNYDAFSTPGAMLNPKTGRRSKSRGGRYEMKKALKRWQPEVWILDESHRIKTPGARKTRMIVSLGPVAPYRLILTGTVLTKKKRMHDIYSQWKFLNPSSPLVRNHTAGTFKTEYAQWTNRNGYPQWIRNRNLARLRRLMHGESFAVTREECFDLPPRTNQIIPVTLTGHNAELYDQMAQTMVAKIKTGEITTAPIKIVQSLRLAQLTSGIAKTAPTKEHPEGRLVRVGKDKLEALEDILADLFEAEEKVVIAARWRADLAAIAKLSRRLKAPAFELHGGVSRAQGDLNRTQFNRHDGKASFIMQPAAGGLGIDLSAASIFIWFGLTNSWVDFTQAEDRVALSSKPTTFMYLLAGGVDDTMYESLGEDGDLAKEVTRSPEHLLRGFRAQIRQGGKNKKVAGETAARI